MTALSEFKIVGSSLAEIELTEYELITFIVNYAYSKYPKHRANNRWCTQNLQLFYNNSIMEKNIRNDKYNRRQRPLLECY